jgi:hypothetical protein
VFIGRWITQGHRIDRAGEPAGSILASDIYAWVPGGFFVVHFAEALIGQVSGGGVEIMGFDPSTQRYWSQFFDSQGNASTSELALDGEQWTWQREDTRCRATFGADGRMQTGHHEQRNEDGEWVPSMDVVLTKVGADTP